MRGSNTKSEVRARIMCDEKCPDDSEDAPRHGSNDRESLDIPEAQSSLADRLTMLNLGANSACKQPNLATSSERNSSTSRVGAAAFPSNRPGWGMDQGGLEQKGPTLMEQMMAEAGAAKKQTIETKRQAQRADTGKGFVGGLKKGFLSATGASSAKHRTRKPCTAAKAATEERRDTSTVKAGSTTLKAAGGSSCQDLPLITGRSHSSGGLEFDVAADAEKNEVGLVFPEVQEAMKTAKAPLGGNEQGSEERRSADWLTPELLDKISEKPRLATMLTDPRFAKAMQLMSTDPQEALSMFASSPEARDTFTELMALLANHFQGMGEAAEEQASRDEADRKRVADGPLAQAALGRAAEGIGATAKPPTGQELEDVDRVLKKPELRDLLLDPEMQKVLQECGEPAALARYMHHPHYGPKLRLMAKSGLVSFSQ